MSKKNCWILAKTNTAMAEKYFRQKRWLEAETSFRIVRKSYEKFEVKHVDLRLKQVMEELQSNVQAKMWGSCKTIFRDVFGKLRVKKVELRSKKALEISWENFETRTL